MQFCIFVCFHLLIIDLLGMSKSWDTSHLTFAMEMKESSLK